jgi:hypothetical protein
MEVVVARQPKAKKQINLFYCSECEELALKVAASSDAIHLQSINWRYAPRPPPPPPPRRFRGVT